MYMAIIFGWDNVIAFSEDEEKAKKLAIKRKKKSNEDYFPDKWDWNSVTEFYGANVVKIKEGYVDNF